MTKLWKATFIALVLGAAGMASADTLDMNGTSPQPDSVGPAGGMTQASVEANFGSPIEKKAPVGDPPISSWEYASFIVYFENDRVIHAVKKR